MMMMIMIDRTKSSDQWSMKWIQT